MNGNRRYEYISWSRFYGLCGELARRIRDDGFEPDAIVGIARGGYAPARVLADLFDTMNLAAMKVEHYHATRKSREAVIRHPLPEGFFGKRVLLVDDVSDSGDTFDAALAHLRTRPGIGEVRTAVLHHKETSTYEPDYYAHRIIAWRWIIYPWALTEDLKSLTADWDSLPATAEDLALRLQRVHGLKVPVRALRTVTGFL